MHLMSPNQREKARENLAFLFYIRKEVIIMTCEERYQKYQEEYCKNCRNSTTDLCEIRVFATKDSINTKCAYYEKEN